jgi:hypothetical protein
MSDYATKRISDIDEVTDGRVPWRRVRIEFGIESFGINAFTAHEVGDRMINEHDEADGYGSEEELYLVQSGRATFELNGERVDAPAGTLVFARGSVTRTAFAEEPGTTIVAIGGSPGKVYQATGWEFWAPLQPLYAAGKYAEVVDRGKQVLDEYPDFPMIAYNVACCEALEGRTAEAIEHLRLAVDKSEDLRQMATEDSDLDSLRDEPAFKEMIGAKQSATS